MSTMRRLRGDFARAVRMPQCPGVPRLGVTLVGEFQLAITGSLLLIAVSLVWLATSTLSSSPAFRAFEGALVCAAVVLFGVGAIRYSRVRRFGRLPLTLDPPSPHRGSHVRMRIALNAPPPAEARLTARVSCMRFQFRPYGRSYRVYGESLWESQTSLQLTDQSSVETTVILPPDKPASSLPNGLNSSHVGDCSDLYGWVLEVFDDAGKVPIRGCYRLPVE